MRKLSMYTLTFTLLVAVDLLLSCSLVWSAKGIEDQVTRAEAVIADAERTRASYAYLFEENPMEDALIDTALEEQGYVMPTEAARYPLSDRERELVERVAMAEAGDQGFDGIALVCQCVLNTAEERGMRPDAVVLEAGQYAAPVESEKVTAEVQAAVSAVFDHGYTVTDKPIRFFYAPALCRSKWHETQEFVLEHGGHRFFMEAAQ